MGPTTRKTASVVSLQPQLRGYGGYCTVTSPSKNYKCLGGGASVELSRVIGQLCFRIRNAAEKAANCVGHQTLRLDPSTNSPSLSKPLTR